MSEVSLIKANRDDMQTIWEMQELRIFEGAKENIQAIFEKVKVKE